MSKTNDDYINRQMNKDNRGSKSYESKNKKSGDYTKFVNFLLMLKQLPPIDRKDASQIEERINLYFKLCSENDIRPGIEQCCVALGFDRMTFYNMYSNRIKDKDVVDVAQRARQMFTALTEAYMIYGTINPVSAIFMLKNNAGYLDKSQIEVVPSKDLLGDSKSIKELQAQYADYDVDFEDKT